MPFSRNTCERIWEFLFELHVLKFGGRKKVLIWKIKNKRFGIYANSSILQSTYMYERNLKSYHIGSDSNIIIFRVDRGYFNIAQKDVN